MIRVYAIPTLDFCEKHKQVKVLFYYVILLCFDVPNCGVNKADALVKTINPNMLVPKLT